jgi:nitroimidazol reductase NimA-like FMN-containing flavoprotein (pyridoxamine 5'-phosphate oxidase superfamily)
MMVPMMFTHDDPVLVLDEEQSWKLLENTRHGRIVLSAAGETDLFPVNYRAHDGVLLMRTAPGTKLAELTINANVLFEADGIFSEEAWSVVVKGKARVLIQDQEIADAEALNLKSWVPTLKDFYVEIKPSQINGRHFNLGEQPERF